MYTLFKIQVSQTTLRYCNIGFPPADIRGRTQYVLACGGRKVATFYIYFALDVTVG